MTDNARKVFDYLKTNYGTDITAQAMAKDLGISINAVTGSVNGLCRDTKHPAYAVRKEVEVAGEDGKASTIKYISLTDEGLAFNPDAAE